MAEYIPSPTDWVREQVELYEGSGGTDGTTLRDSGLPVIIVTNRGNQTGAIRKTPLMRVKDGNNYVLVGSGVARRGTRCGCITFGRTATWKFGTRLKCTRCGSARLRVRRNGRGCGSWRWRRSRPTRSIRTVRRGGFRCSLRSRRDGGRLHQPVDMATRDFAASSLRYSGMNLIRA